MPLKITLFNVGHGDSIVIEEISGDQTTGVITIDSNLVKVNGKFESPAYNYLKSKNIKTINAVMLTHFDSDHYAGIELFLENFKIHNLFIPPVFSLSTSSFNDKLKSIKDRIRDKAALSHDPDYRTPLLSLAKLIAYIKDNKAIVEEYHGKEQVLRVAEMSIGGMVYLPVAGIKGLINQKLDQNKFDLDVFSNMNETSVAFKIVYEGIAVLFAGDSEKSQWMEHKRLMRAYHTDLGIDILKSPHHGSKYNNNLKIYEYLFGTSTEGKHVLVSANGKSHPHSEFFELVEQLKLKPLCTNMSHYCYDNILPFNKPSNLPAIAKVFLSNYENVEPTIPCQGDIILNIDQGRFRFSTSNSVPCIY